MVAATSTTTTATKLTTNEARNNSPPAIIPASNEPMDLNAELKHFTLKRQMQQQQQQQQQTQQPKINSKSTHLNATEANLRTNRGPPPQPPKVSSINRTMMGSQIRCTLYYLRNFTCHFSCNTILKFIDVRFRLLFKLLIL